MPPTKKTRRENPTAEEDTEEPSNRESAQQEQEETQPGVQVIHHVLDEHWDDSLVSDDLIGEEETERCHSAVVPVTGNKLNPVFCYEYSYVTMIAWNDGGISLTGLTQVSKKNESKFEKFAKHLENHFFANIHDIQSIRPYNGPLVFHIYPFAQKHLSHALSEGPEKKWLQFAPLVSALFDKEPRTFSEIVFCPATHDTRVERQMNEALQQARMPPCTTTTTTTTTTITTTTTTTTTTTSPTIITNEEIRTFLRRREEAEQDEVDVVDAQMLQVLSDRIFNQPNRTLFAVKWANPLSLPITNNSTPFTPHVIPPPAVPQAPTQPPLSCQLNLVFCKDLNELFWIVKEISPDFLHCCFWQPLSNGICVDVRNLNQVGDKGAGESDSEWFGDIHINECEDLPIALFDFLFPTFYSAWRHLPLPEYPHFAPDGTPQTIQNEITPALHNKLIQALQSDIEQILDHNNQLCGRQSNQAAPCVRRTDAPPFHTITHTSTSCHFLNFVPDILEKILSYLTTDDVITASQVCRRLYWYCMKPSLWKKLFLWQFNATAVPEDFVHTLEEQKGQGDQQIPLWKQLFIERWLFASQTEPTQQPSP